MRYATISKYETVEVPNLVNVPTFAVHNGIHLTLVTQGKQSGESFPEDVDPALRLGERFMIVHHSIPPWRPKLLYKVSTCDTPFPRGITILST
jgi:hypothetical protein